MTWHISTELSSDLIDDFDEHTVLTVAALEISAYIRTVVYDVNIIKNIFSFEILKVWKEI